MPAEETARYARIAEELRRRMDAGILAPGIPFPSDSELQAEFDTARGTVRQALDALRREGRIYTIKGRGSYVRPRFDLLRVAAARYRADVESTPERPQSSVTYDYNVKWGQHNPDAVITEERASADVADLFGVAEGTLLVRRDLVFRQQEGKHEGWPTHMATSYYLADMVAGTPVAGPESEPAQGGAIGHLASLGVRVTKVVETLESRMPSEREAEVLRMSAGPVVAITRKMLAGDRVVEVAKEIVYPGDGVRLEYEINL
jgi:GntR family transcriptional regulator